MSRTQACRYHRVGADNTLPRESAAVPQLRLSSKARKEKIISSLVWFSVSSYTQPPAQLRLLEAPEQSVVLVRMVRRPAVRPIPRFCTEQCVLEILSPSCESSVTIRLVPALQKLLPFTVPSSRVVVTASSRRRRAVVRSSPPRRPATRPRRDRVVAGLHLPHQRHRRPSSPHPSASPRRRITWSSSPCRRVVVAASPLHGWGWHLRGVAPDLHFRTRRRALLRACSPLAHLLQTGMSCRAVCMFCAAPPTPRAAVSCLVAHLVVVHLGRHLVVHLLCTRHSWVMHQQGTGPAPAARVALSPPRRRRVVTSSSHRHRVVVVRRRCAIWPPLSPSPSPRRLHSLTPAHGVVASSFHGRLVVVVASSSPHGIPAVSPHGIPHLVRRGFTRYPHLSPRLYPRLAHPHPAWVRSEAASTQRGHPLGTCFWPL